MLWIEELGKHIGEKVILRGWVYNRRDSGKVRFVLLRDGTGICQCVFADSEVEKKYFELADSVNQESLVEVEGTIREFDRAPGGVELAARSMKLLADSVDYPITPKEHGIDFLLSRRHLWLRSSRQHALLRCRDTLIRAFHEFFGERGFILIDPPMITPTSCEGTTELFEISYFDDKAYLSQSGQLYMEPAAAAFGKVYCLAPSFRAEKSKTRRHLTEFWHLEPEVAFLDLAGDMELAEEMLSFVVKELLEGRSTEIEFLGTWGKNKQEKRAFREHIELLKNLNPPFYRITYTDAVKLLAKKGVNIQWGDKFGADEEAIISAVYDKPVFCHRYPKRSAPFYMKEDPENPELVKNFDLLAPEGYGEIIGGSQREDDLAKLEAAIERHNLPREPLEWYLDIRRYGTFVHSGFGIGVERTLAWITQTHHIRVTIPYPRLMDRIYP
ncbi:asparagine--tRNA ligase [candidate division WOR-3 bacterium]|uniref:Asparagine--tRNA ligase n=1 Tax=candidate division WOR-3 bacterium TaxID=2052148 RepID=A0A9D5KAF4_UNCW3|nr:asparagine--tRNA ligase [candidate division WOR-3 bacterium]MBD3365075.1 asparagine--tRNA ligase [candidate division WOR-3 bacterium]